jgi:hypothetical protein
MAYEAMIATNFRVQRGANKKILMRKKKKKMRKEKNMSMYDIKIK